MTRLDWSKARRPRGWTYEASPGRPATAADYLLGGSERRRDRPAPKPETAITLAYLAGHGVNRIAAWCAACRTAEHRPIDGIPADVRALPLEQLGEAVRCDACAGPTTVSPFTEGPARHVGSNL